MAQRNAYGCTTIGNRCGLKGWSVRVATVSIYAAALGLLAALLDVPYAGSFALLFSIVWLIYLCGRLLSRQRWRFFANPFNFMMGVMVVMVFDTGILCGTLNAVCNKYISPKQ